MFLPIEKKWWPRIPERGNRSRPTGDNGPKAPIVLQPTSAASPAVTLQAPGPDATCARSHIAEFLRERPRILYIDVLLPLERFPLVAQNQYYGADPSRPSSNSTNPLGDSGVVGCTLWYRPQPEAPRYC